MFIYLWRQLFTALLGLSSAVAPFFRQPIARFLPMQSVAPATTLDHAGDPLDRWTSRARPTFLYVMYAMMLWAFPLGLTAAFSPNTARAMTAAMTEYLSALPEALYTLFGTCYLGYATLRQWGKVKGTDR